MKPYDKEKGKPIVWWKFSMADKRNSVYNYNY